MPLKYTKFKEYHHIFPLFAYPTPCSPLLIYSMTPFCICFTLSTDLSTMQFVSLSHFLFVTHSGDGLELCLTCNPNYTSSIDTRILCHCTQIIFQSDIESFPSLHSIGNFHPSATNQLHMGLLAQSQAQGQGQGQAGTQMPSIKSKHKHDEMHIYSGIPTFQIGRAHV